MRAGMMRDGTGGQLAGLAPFAVVPGVLLLAYAAWLVLTVASGRTPGRSCAVAAAVAPNCSGPAVPTTPTESDVKRVARTRSRIECRSRNFVDAARPKDG